MEVHTFHTIELTWPAKQMPSSLGHVATDNNQKTQGHLSHLVINHYGKLLPLSEFLLLPGCMWPSSSSAHVGYKLFSDPWHHLLWSNIWKGVSWPYTDEGNRPVSLSCENKITFIYFFLCGCGWQVKEVTKSDHRQHNLYMITSTLVSPHILNRLKAHWTGPTHRFLTNSSLIFS